MNFVDQSNIYSQGLKTDTFETNDSVFSMINLYAIEHSHCTHFLSRGWRPPVSRRSPLQFQSLSITNASSGTDHLTKLLFSSLHQSPCHCVLLSYRYHGPCPHLARTTCRSCTTCRRISARTEIQQMGQFQPTESLPVLRSPSPEWTS